MANKTWVGNDSGNEGDYSVAANWSPSGVPSASDHVRIPASSTQNISSGLDQSAVAIGDFIVEEGYSGTIGSATGYLQIDPDRFEFNGSGQSWIDIGSAAIDVQILGTATASTGERGLYLKGSAIDELAILGGNVGVAAVHGETATVTTCRVTGPTADVWVGAGTTLTTLNVSQGTVRLRCAATTVTQYGGTLYTEESGAITTINLEGGTLYPNSSGTITTLNADGGTADFTASGLGRTVSTLKQNPGSAITYDPSVLTITTRSAPDDPISLRASAA
jgi:hypothetical protein